jgi:hypothetical protein
LILTNALYCYIVSASGAHSRNDGRFSQAKMLIIFN